MELKAQYSLVHIFIIVGFFYTTSDIDAQELKKKVFINAQIRDSKTGAPVIFANVINQSRNWWAISDTAGIVRLPAYVGDSITITSIGYFLTRFLINDSILHSREPIQISIEEKIYELSRVDIHALGSYEDFKYKLLKMKMFDRLADLKDRIKFDKDKLPRHPLGSQMSIPLGSPITAIYNLFSKEERSKRKLAEALKSEELIRYAEIKYSRSLVGRVTGLTDKHLDEFILKYRPSIDYLIYATEYDVIGKIIRDFELFKAEMELKESETK